MTPSSEPPVVIVDNVMMGDDETGDGMYVSHHTPPCYDTPTPTTYHNHNLIHPNPTLTLI